MSDTSISIVTTNDPRIIKFEANTMLTQQQSYEFANIDEAKYSPLAQHLFHLPFVNKIYITTHFIAIERYDIVDWKDVQQDVAEQIESYINNDGVVITKNSSTQKTAVTVYAESTPNPEVLKFVANKVLVSELQEHTSVETTQNVPFAKALFQFPFVKHIFINKNYVSITKHDTIVWQDITMELRDFIKTYIEQGKPILNENHFVSKNIENESDMDLENLDDISKQIIHLLNEHVKPAVASDGGNIQFQSYNKDNKIVKVLLQGACSGCPSSTVTLKNGIETMLKSMLGEHVNEVEAING